MASQDVPPKIGEWKKKETSRGAKYPIWTGSSWTTGGNIQPKGRKYNPKGYSNPYEDYNPFLEEVSTIKTKFGGSGTAVNGAGGSVRYPHDMLIDEAEDFVMFDFYDYRPPFKDKQSLDDAGGESYANLTLGDYNASGYAGDYFKDKAYPQILLYMPQDIQDAFSAKWEGKKFGAMTTGMIAAAGQEGTIDKIKSGGKTLDKALKKSMVEAAASIVTGLATKITGDQISAGDLFGGISGVARNPNVEVLFQSMELRTFDLTFKMSPFDDQDSLRIEAIIKIFKQAMLPQYKLGKDVKVFGQENDALQAGFIQVPKVCAVNFMRGNDRNRFLPRYKMCAITDVNVNYTPDNVYATIDRNMPVATELKISFMETKLVFSEDVQERGF
tara:strand:+ start:69 stop:1223 length:1155 start_codon:yes stop_codon:yes gene_type:complete